jgi:putative transposase
MYGLTEREIEGNADRTPLLDRIAHQGVNAFGLPEQALSLNDYLAPMSIHAHTRCWLHLIWNTKDKARILPRPVRPKLSDFLDDYAESKNIHMRANYVIPEHVHALIDLPANESIANVAKLLKGSSSHWINKNRLIAGRFSWGRGYAAFSVSQSHVERVVDYIDNQEEHHRRKTYGEELDALIAAYELEMGKPLKRL